MWIYKIPRKKTVSLFSYFKFVLFIFFLHWNPTSGYRCEWCGMTTHSGCRSYITNECTFGVLQPIYLPPHAVSIPRTEVPMEAIIGVQVRSRSTPLQRDYSCRKYIYSKLISTLHLWHIFWTAENQKNQNVNQPICKLCTAFFYAKYYEFHTEKKRVEGLILYW